MGRHKWRDIQAELNAAEPGRAERMAAAAERGLREYDAYQRNLPALRRARELTQQEVARKLEVGQGQVSKLENQADMYLSTLAGYVRALGGELKLAAVFDGVEVPVSLPALAAPEEIEEIEEKVAA